MWSRCSIVMMMLACGGRLAHAASSHDTMGAVSIRIHDYARIPSRDLQRTEQRISDIYARIGVRLDWRAPVRPMELEAGCSRRPADGNARLTVVILNAEMSGRLRVGPGVAGYAAISRERGGRMAFVLGERAHALAIDSGVALSQVLAGIVAHEIAHLLMPERTHSDAGMMRANWTSIEFRDVDRARFSESEVASIRQRVSSMGGTPSQAD